MRAALVWTLWWPVLGDGRRTTEDNTARNRRTSGDGRGKVDGQLMGVY